MALIEVPELPFHDLAERHYGLTVAVSSSITEAARICLDRHHLSPTQFKLEDHDNKRVTVAVWNPSTNRERVAWANETVATEFGACAIAIAATELSRRLYTVQRAETRTGADYYLAPAGKTIVDLEDCWRLEVSGTDRGEWSTIRQRLREKLNQAHNGLSNLPAIAAVVGFREKVILLAPLESA